MEKVYCVQKMNQKQIINAKIELVLMLYPAEQHFLIQMPYVAHGLQVVSLMEQTVLIKLLPLALPIGDQPANATILVLLSYLVHY